MTYSVKPNLFMEHSKEMLARVTGKVRSTGPLMPIKILTETEFVNRSSFDWRLHNAIGFVKD